MVGGGADEDDMYVVFCASRIIRQRSAIRRGSRAVRTNSVSKVSIAAATDGRPCSG